jgi:hypothetical protein
MIRKSVAHGYNVQECDATGADKVWKTGIQK